MDIIHEYTKSSWQHFAAKRGPLSLSRFVFDVFFMYFLCSLAYNNFY